MGEGVGAVSSDSPRRPTYTLCPPLLRLPDSRGRSVRPVYVGVREKSPRSVNMNNVQIYLKIPKEFGSEPCKCCKFESRRWRFSCSDPCHPRSHFCTDLFRRWEPRFSESEKLSKWRHKGLGSRVRKWVVRDIHKHWLSSFWKEECWLRMEEFENPPIKVRFQGWGFVTNNRGEEQVIRWLMTSSFGTLSWMFETLYGDTGSTMTGGSNRTTSKVLRTGHIKGSPKSRW